MLKEIFARRSCRRLHYRGSLVTYEPLGPSSHLEQCGPRNCHQPLFTGDPIFCSISHFFLQKLNSVVKAFASALELVITALVRQIVKNKGNTVRLQFHQTLTLPNLPF